jgi:hypothetical protein
MKQNKVEKPGKKSKKKTVLIKNGLVQTRLYGWRWEEGRAGRRSRRKKRV